MKKCLFLWCFVLFWAHLPQVSAQKYQINNYYSVELTGSVLDSKFDKRSNTLEVSVCSLPISLRLLPNQGFNGSYNLLRNDNSVVEDFERSRSGYDINEAGEYTLKDGPTSITKIKLQLTNATKLYQVILVDEHNKEITDFSPHKLNCSKLHAAIKDMVKNKIERCGGQYVWAVNDQRVFDINQVVFKPGDDVLVGIDKVSTCTRNCYDYGATAYKVKGQKPALPLKNTITDGSLQIFPNPSQDYIKINYANIKQITLLDQQVRMIKEYRNTRYEREMKLDLQDLPNGLYYLHILTDRELLVRKFFKK
jgi:Secretion system C-terminal sorting domain